MPVGVVTAPTRAVPLERRRPARGRSSGAALESLLGRCVWSDADASGAGVAILHSPLVSVGGGLGSFALVDFLRIAGVGCDAITVLGGFEEPHAVYRQLCRYSQIADCDPLRSDSMSRIDNIWGFPGYALEDALRRRSVRPLLRVLVEPVLDEFYTPPADLVYAAVEREARRIGWRQMLDRGRALAVRRRRRGGYFVLFRRERACGRELVLYRCRYVHAALGYPAIRLLPDVREYRERTGDRLRLVNAYEPHEHVYRALRTAPGRVLVRGAGITASRILQRLFDENEQHGTAISVVHLLRRAPAGRSGAPGFRRPTDGAFAHQAFTFPKAAGGGQLRSRVLALDGDDRASLIAELGGTTTPKRELWSRQIARAATSGLYELQIGTVTGIRPARSGGLQVSVSTPAGRSEIDVDYAIDATGLESDIRRHALVCDLLRCGAGLNALGGIDVGPRFEVRGMRRGAGRVYASGPITKGGYLAPVDSFWGLTHAALHICDDLADHGFCPRIDAARSLRGWCRWVRGRAP